jgi:hypothetical protein
VQTPSNTVLAVASIFSILTLSSLWAAPKRSEKSTLDQQIVQLEKEVQKYTTLMGDEDVKSDKEISVAIRGKWLEATCQLKKLRVTALLENSDAAAADAVYKACKKRLEAEVESVSTAEDASKQGQAVNIPCVVPAVTLKLEPVDLSPIQMPASKADRSKQVQLDFNSSGKEINTKEAVYLRYIHRLRYDASLGGSLTAIPAPSIPTALTGGNLWNNILPIPTAGKPPQEEKERTLRAAEGQSERFNAKYGQYVKCFEQYEKTLRTFQEELQTQEAALNNAREAIVDQLTSLSVIGRTAEETRAAADLSIFPKEQPPTFPTADVARLSSSLSTFKTNFGQLTTDEDFEVWSKIGGNKAAYDQIGKAIDDFLNVLDGYGPLKDEVKAYETNRRFVFSWRQHFQTVAGANDEYFIVDFKPACGGWFGQGTRTQMQLSVHDRLNPTQSKSVTNLDSIVCHPTLGLSSGLGFSFISSSTPAFVPAIKKDPSGNPVLDEEGNAVLVETLGYSNENRVNPSYALLINSALLEAKRFGFGLHWGIGALLTGTGDGATLDIITGPSFSFKNRAFFISPVYDLGRRTRYLPQFALGTEKGNLTSPPTHQVWRSGVGLTITFPLSLGNSSTSSSSGTSATSTATDAPSGGSKDEEAEAN